jgi:uncharacterized damage-inducible protein DinB
VLLDYLDFYRGVVAAKLEGLSADELSGSVVPSGWTPSGLVHHLVNVERRWLEWGFLGEQIEEPWRDAMEGGGWLPLELPVAELQAMLDDAAARTRSIVEAHPLTDVSALTGRFRDAATGPQLQWILLHLVQEYARHTGHLDIARELIDGETGEGG